MPDPQEPMIPLRLLPPAQRRRGVISVTVPSRGRVAKLAASIASLRDTAKHPELIEVLVAYDPDDLDTAAVAFQLHADVIWRAPERYGYARSARYWAELASRSTGDWVLLTWSDDATMITEGWDELLRAQRPGTVAYLDGNYPGLTCFPAVHADALSAVGRMCPLPALDTWWEYTARDAGVLVTPGIYVHQDRPDITGCAPDRTYAEGGGAWRAGPGGTPYQAFYQVPYQGWREQDTAALKWHRMLEADYEQRMSVWSDIQEQVPILRDTVRRYWRPVVAELGTRTGESTSALLAGASASGGHVYSVDIGPVAPSEWWGKTGLWQFLSADDMGAKAAEFIPAKLDVLFIDTSHTYEHTLGELRRYVPRVKPGGTVLMHDPELRGDDPIMGWEWVRNAPNAPEFPVAAAIDTYCAETGLTWERQTDRPAPAAGRPFYGLGTIRIPGG
jgi:predicted O-methyltransferase YrrM